MNQQNESRTIATAMIGQYRICAFRSRFGTLDYLVQDMQDLDDWGIANVVRQGRTLAEALAGITDAELLPLAVAGGTQAQDPDWVLNGLAFWTDQKAVHPRRLQEQLEVAQFSEWARMLGWEVRHA